MGDVFDVAFGSDIVARARLHSYARSQGVYAVATKDLFDVASGLLHKSGYEKQGKEKAKNHCLRMAHVILAKGANYTLRQLRSNEYLEKNNAPR